VSAFDFGRDGGGDPTLVNTFDPGIDPLHPSWFVLALAEDLLVLAPSMHSVHSLFALSALVSDLGSVSAPHSGYVDLKFPGTINDSSTHAIRVAWLRRFTDFTNAAVTIRNGTGVNVNCYGSSDLPIIGDLMTLEIDFTHQGGSGFYGIYGFDAPITYMMSFGQEVLVHPGSQILFYVTGTGSGAPHQIDLGIPASPALMGFTAYTQAFTTGGSGLQLGNAVDLLCGY